MYSEIPESLCWHVLDGIAQALLWLHHGVKRTFLPNRLYDDDWHPIIGVQISPKNSEAIRKISQSNKLLIGV